MSSIVGSAKTLLAQEETVITRFALQTEDGDRLASREAFMMMHPARDPDCTLKEGDVIELEEGFFVLNDDLNPMELA